MRGPARKTIELLAAAVEILAEIQPAPVRAVAYRLFVRGLIPIMNKSNTNAISRLLTRAREDGVVPWDYIVDETREAETSGRWNNTAELVRVMTRNYRRDYWQEQPRRVEVWSEKGTVRGTLGPVLAEFGVTFRVMHGYASATVANDVAEESLADERPLHALYCGDWDPSGLHMSEVDLPDRVERYGGDVDLDRIALLHADLDALPCFSPENKAKDARLAWFKREINTQCCELDALPPPELRDRVARAITRLIDWNLWQRAIEVERVERETIEVFGNSWQATICKPETEDE